MGYKKGNPTFINIEHTEKIDNLDAQLAETSTKIQNAWIDPSVDFGAVGDAVTDDTQSIQNAIDYAYTQLSEFDKKIRVNLGNKIYSITGLKIPRGITLYGDSTLELKGNGNTALNYETAAHCLTEGIKILLTADNQIGINVDSVDGETSSQLNTFRNIWIEGDNYKDTLGVRLGHTWVNNFYDCKIFRCADGLEFATEESNANYFYGCELRHTNTHENSKLAILHRGGKSNAFIGGVIENYNSFIEMRNGDLKCTEVYFEAPAIDRPITLEGESTLTIDNSLVKFKVEIRGGNLLRITNSELNRGSVVTNNNSPFILFRNDVNTRVVMENNDIPDDISIARWGMYRDDVGGWSMRSPQNKHERYLDRTMITQGHLVNNIDNVTGDGSEYNLTWDDSGVVANPYNELNASIGLFSPKNDGLYRVKATIRINNLTVDHNNCTLFLKEAGSSARNFIVDEKNARDKDTQDRLHLSGEVVIDVRNLMNIRFSVRVDGTNKTVGIEANPSELSNWSYYEIERMA